MKIRYLPRAEADLDTIVAYLQNETPSGAVRFIGELEDGLSLLGRFPYAAPETNRAGIRRLYLRRFRYSVFYTVKHNEIVITHIRHAARRPL